ncbi:DMT family transporter [Fusobacterium polymorphum]|jgi:choline transport protein|uniref:DMT family transporter n=1 Tax=Fusobacterium nucleatum subsp. polymorphum TaxID=76857 RepID=UPI00300A6E45
MDKSYKYGVIAGLFSGITWALYTIINNLITKNIIFNSYIEKMFIPVLVIVFLHDFFSSIWLFFYLWRKRKLFELKRTIKSKNMFLIFLGALFGGPIGMSGYLLGIKYMGASYTASFSCTYLILGTILSVVFLKEKINLKMIIAVLINMAGIFILNFQVNEMDSDKISILGIFSLILCIFGWALEGLIASYILKYKNADTEPSIAIFIRQLTSTVFYSFLIIPYIRAYNLVFIVLKSNIALYIALISVIGSLSFFLWYYSMSIVGVARGISLNISYIIWTIIFEIIVFNVKFQLNFIVASILLIVSVILIAISPEEKV